MSAEPFFSPQWYRVAGLIPKLPEHVEVRRHSYRGQTWYVLYDSINGRVHRLSKAGCIIVAAMDGTNTVAQVWQQAISALAEEAPSQGELISFLNQLYANDILHTDAPLDTAEFLERSRQVRLKTFWQTVRNPMSIRIRLFDPEALLQRTIPAFRWAFGWAGLALWLAVIAPALFLAGQNAAELGANTADRILALDNLALMAVSYVCIKAIHELGHAYAVKAYGGAVHEIGVMFLVFFPVPYVDASASGQFRSKHRRVVVGAAGMLVETFVAALAFYVWLLVEPGIVRSVAFNVVLVAGLSTVIFNGNPLLRYDGYFILSDLIEIPNLGVRANKYWTGLIEHGLFRVPRREPSVANSRAEHLWFLFYAPAALVYRLIVMLSIALYIASQYLAIGVALAVWSVFSNLGLPVIKAIWYLLQGARLRRYRVRAVSISMGAAAVTALFLFVVKFPAYTVAEGVVWLPEQAIVRAGTEGFIQSLLIGPDSVVRPGDALLESSEPTLQWQIKELRGRVEELEVQLASQRFNDRSQAEISAVELRQAQADLDNKLTRAARLISRSRSAGIFSVAQAEDLPGRYAREGQILAYVLPKGTRTIRVAVRQDDIDLVRTRTKSVSVRLAEHMEHTMAATLVREVPAGDDELPSKALGTIGGGSFQVNPGDSKGTKATQRVFQFEVELQPQEPAAQEFGSRVYVRFEHDWEPLGFQLWRRFRQLILARVQT